MLKESEFSKALSPQFARNWVWLLGLGILFVILGCIGFSMVVGVTLASILFLGVLFIVAGFAQLIDVFKCNEWKGSVWHALVAFLYIIVGCLVIYDPLLASAIITAILAWILIVIGVARLMMAFVLRHGAGWGWIAFAGIMSLILGVLILMQWPVSALWVIGLLITIELIVNGWTYIFVALALRKA